MPESGKPPAPPTATLAREIEAAEIPGRRRLTKSPDAAGTTVDCLNMRGWRSTGITYERHQTVIHAELLTELTHCRCKKCGGRCRSTKLTHHGWTETQYLDHTPSDERPRVIAYRRRRYRCLECKHTSSQPVPGVYKGTEMTRQLRRYIARQSLLPEESFSAIARRVGRSEKSVRDVFEQHRAHLESVREIETPRVMGLDGVYVRRRESLIVVDIERRRPVMMRRSVKTRAVADALRELPDPDKVEEVLSDMAGPLDEAPREVLPRAVRTNDRYHAQRLANDAVDTVRKALTPGRKGRKKGAMAMCDRHLLRKRKQRLKPADKASLDWCLGLYPLLRLTYELKEAHCEMWNSPDGAAARLKHAEWLQLHEAWKEKMPEDLRGAFDPLVRVMEKWEEGIFNYFRRRHTNACTEAANARVKRFTAMAPRAELETVETKIVHGTRLKQQRVAARERGKPRRERRAEQPAPPASPVSGVTTSSGETPASETHAAPTAAGPASAGERQRGPRLDMARIAALKASREKGGRPEPPVPPQMALFR